MNKQLSYLLENLQYEICEKDPADSADGILGMDIPAVVSDDRNISEGCLFICCPITNNNGPLSLIKAANAHAGVIVTEKGLLEEALAGIHQSEKEFLGNTRSHIIFVPDSRYAMAFIYAAWFDHPADRMTTIGITCTKGKTTVAYMLYDILKAAGHKVGLIGTVELIIGEERKDAFMTTPEADFLQEYMHKMVEAGVEILVIEVSSQALMTHRSQGFVFDYGVFTNIGIDHIGPDECRDFDQYLYCKGLLFKQCGTGFVNADDPHTAELLEGHTCKVKTYGLSEDADLHAANISYSMESGVPGVSFDAKGTAQFRIDLPMPGLFSVSNALAAASAALELGVKEYLIADALRSIYVKGRMNVIKPPEAFRTSYPPVVVDFAHNAISLRTAIETLKDYCVGRIICVFNGVGTRIRWKGMGEVSGELADLSVVTGGDTRQFELEDIIHDIVEGIRENNGDYVVIPERREAVRYALSVGTPEDLILLTGRGHYKNLTGKDGVVPYPDDNELVREIFDSLCGKEGKN